MCYTKVRKRDLIKSKIVFCTYRLFCFSEVDTISRYINHSFNFMARRLTTKFRCQRFNASFCFPISMDVKSILLSVWILLSNRDRRVIHTWCFSLQLKRNALWICRFPSNLIGISNFFTVINCTTL